MTLVAQVTPLDLGPRLAELRDYQHDLKIGIDDVRYGRPRPSCPPPYTSHNRVAAVMKTGAGKTVTFSDYIRDEIELRGARRIYVVVHRDALVKQAKNTLHSLMPGVKIGIEKAEKRHSPDDHVVIVSIQTAKGKRLLTLPPPDMVVVDETHHVAAPTYQAALRHFGCFEDEDPTFMLGVTATLIRGDSKDLAETFDRRAVVEGPDLLWLIRNHFLVAPRRLTIKVKDLHLEDVKTSRGDMADGSLGSALSDADAPAQVAAAIAEHAADRRPIAFSPTKDVAWELRDELVKLGITCEAITEETGQKEDAFGMSERDYIAARHRSGDTQVVSNVMVMTEGTDWPWVDCIVVNRPTDNPGLYEQMVGRGLRPFPEGGKTDCLIMEVAGGTRQQLITLIDLLGKDSRFKNEMEDGESLLEAAERITQIEKGYAVEFDPQREELVVEDTTESLFAESTSAWLQTRDKGVWFIPTAASYIFLWPKEGAFNLFRVPKTGRRIVLRACACHPDTPYHSDAEVLNLGSQDNPVRATGLTLGWGMKWAERMAEAEDRALAVASMGPIGWGRPSISSRTASWRVKKAPATDAQTRMLWQRWGVQALPGTTKDEASNEIAVLEATEVIDRDV